MMEDYTAYVSQKATAFDLAADPELIKIIIAEAVAAKKEFRRADMDAMIGLYAMHLREQMIQAKDFNPEDLDVLSDEQYECVSSTSQQMKDLMAFVSHNDSIRIVDLNAIARARQAFTDSLLLDVGFTFADEIQALANPQ